MGKYIISFIAGLLFSFGLTLSGMTLPHKVVGFLNIFKDWDVTLIFVMMGAILVHGVAYFFIKKRSSPLFDTKFHHPTKKNIDKKLTGGAILFGIGWALAGLCPGPAIVSLASGSSNIFIFITAMIFGSIISRKAFE